MASIEFQRDSQKVSWQFKNAGYPCLRQTKYIFIFTPHTCDKHEYRREYTTKKKHHHLHQQTAPSTNPKLRHKTQPPLSRGPSKFLRRLGAVLNCAPRFFSDNRRQRQTADKISISFTRERERGKERAISRVEKSSGNRGIRGMRRFQRLARAPRIVCPPPQARAQITRRRNAARRRGAVNFWDLGRWGIVWMPRAVCVG